MLKLQSADIRVAEGSNSCARVPRKVLEQAGWRPGETVTLRFGSAQTKVRLDVAEGQEWTIPSAVIRRLCLPARRLNCQINRELRSVRFGPLIGIMTTWAMSPYFGSVMRAAAQSGMMAVVFRPCDLVAGQSRFTAWALRHGQVRRVRVPLPDVVYNRIPNRGGEVHAATRQCKHLLTNRGIPIFNRSFFHKWRIYRLLSQDPEGNAFLPESHPLTNCGVVLRMLRRYPMVYLKPNGGSKGMGIVKVNRLRGGKYAVSYRRGDHNYQLIGANWVEAEQLIRKGMYHRSYVIQEGLPLARYHGRPFDVRVTLYKGGDGQWVVCGPAAKIAGKGSITTHVHNGGRVVPLGVVLNHAFGEQAEQVREHVNRAAITIAQSIERVTHLQLGELGLDIGVTALGRVALFEANSKPGRMIFNPRWARSERRRSLLCLLGYAARLAGFLRKEGYDDQRTDRD
jgi:hypothetical protein